MKERPILFSGPMVTAIIGGRKTQTRRALRPQPPAKLADTVHYDRATGGAMWASFHGDHGTHCPYGKPGDRLWVREAWLVDRYDGSTQYRASHPSPSLPNWKPSIHMPRERSRLNLLVQSVRVERLKDITETDARAEGIDAPTAGSYRAGYALLWDAINGKRGLVTWTDNPWVWVIDFRVAA